MASKKKKKKKNSVFYRVSSWLHLWLGLASGIVVVLVSITGAVLTFEEELEVLFEPFQTVEVKEKLLPPSILAENVKEKYGFPSVYGVYYRGEDRSAMVPYYADPSNYQEAYVNPYTGEVLHNRELNNDFFRFMIEGHYQLWLPRNIGKPIVAYGTLIFVLMLITGLVLWWPKKWTKAERKKAFSVKWNAKFKRVNYDLHNAVGFYSLLIALVLGLTGMVYGMQWFKDAVYWAGSGGESMEESRTFSDTTLVASLAVEEEDILFRRTINAGVDPAENKISIFYPRGEKGVWNVSINPGEKSFYQTRNTYYEQHSLKQLKKDAVFSEVNGGEQLMRLNYDLHVGSIGGIWTKIIAFIVCIISASLPITGFLIWWGKRKRKPSKKAIK